MTRKTKTKAQREREQDVLKPFLNRKGPGGVDLDPSEAAAWFPPLDLAEHRSITAGCAVIVAYKGIRFTLFNVEVSQEVGWFFGDIREELPDNDQHLAAGQNIGFTGANVLEVLSYDEMALAAANVVVARAAKAWLP